VKKRKKVRTDCRCNKIKEKREKVTDREILQREIVDRFEGKLK